ncbi:hypothetical protein BJ508DRAFT_411987 [Ascobolus immersus RN42]|uniref:CsbD-like domain-containing protein n=1 Tax=Ascobolus immersus RN42 TaxID=1160509 RepID=A0A3N4IHG9_ASCIM|nr:hypothetical protein BJ508DRAFT_411987 [Ascobolus immersus RN42]
MSSTNNDNSSTQPQPSTLKSYIDSGVAAAQSAISSLTGNTADTRAASDKQDQAQAEREVSKAGANVGPINMSASGVTLSNQDRREGGAKEITGSMKESVGHLIGSDEMVYNGRRENQEGQGQKAAGQVKDYAEGVADRVGGTIGSAAAGLVGNKEKEREYSQMHDTGKTNVRGVEAEVNKEH